MRKETAGALNRVWTHTWQTSTVYDALTTATTAPRRSGVKTFYTLGSWLQVEVTETKIKHKPSIKLKDNKFQIVL